jgi:hypothetical protein
MARLRPLYAVVLALLLSACVNQSIKSTSVPAVATPSTAVAEDQLLDVAVVVFDPGLDDIDEDDEVLVYPEVRQAEARFMPMVLSEAIQDSGAWGAVRVVPNDTQVSDLIVRGKILHSDGEELELEITATDSRGRVWLEKSYTGNASRYAYDTTQRNPHDPFQAVYNTIANDLLRELEELEPRERSDVRLVTELVFARSFSPDAFDGYLEKDRKGEYVVKRLPAEDDPMLLRVREIRERDRVYVDTLQAYYVNFDARMEPPYQEWRKNSYEAAVQLQELKAESTRNLILGGVAVLAGIAAASTGDSSVTRTAGQVGILGGGYLLKSGMDKRNEAQIHVAELEELGASLEAEVAPQVIELEDQTVTLSGNVDEQYNQWRAVLADIYRAEIGELQLPEDAAAADAQ